MTPRGNAKKAVALCGSLALRRVDLGGKGNGDGNWKRRCPKAYEAERSACGRCGRDTSTSVASKTSSRNRSSIGPRAASPVPTRVGGPRLPP